MLRREFNIFQDFSNQGASQIPAGMIGNGSSIRVAVKSMTPFLPYTLEAQFEQETLHLCKVYNLEDGSCTNLDLLQANELRKILWFPLVFFKAQFKDLLQVFF